MTIFKDIEDIGKVANVITKVHGATALSSTTDTQLGAGLGAAASDLDLPSDAKFIIAACPILSSPAGNTANEPIVAKFTLASKSTGMALGDCTFLAQPIGSSLLKSSAQVQGPMKDVVYPIFARIPVGAKLKVSGQGLFDHTIEPYAGIILWITDGDLDLLFPGRFPQRHYAVGTFTNTGTAAAEVSGSKVSFTGARRILEVGGFAVGTTVAALKGLFAKFRLTSSDLTVMQDIEGFFNPASGQVDTNIDECIAGITRLPVSVPVKTPANLIDKATLQVALTTTGNFVIQVCYI
jgi:hypothetical protein